MKRPNQNLFLITCYHRLQNTVNVVIYDLNNVARSSDHVPLLIHL